MFPHSIGTVSVALACDAHCTVVPYAQLLQAGQERGRLRVSLKAGQAAGAHEAYLIY